LEAAVPEYETVKATEFARWHSRIFGVMPGFRQTAKFPPAMEKARMLGFRPVILTDNLMFIEALHAGRYMAAITRTIERSGQPFEPPCALFSSGEMIVTVGSKNGIGGRNQEFALSAAQGIAGSKNIVIASVDTDGTDGPGTQFVQSAQRFPCLAGGIVDGGTVDEAKRSGVDIVEALKNHNTTPALWKLNNGIIATPNISLIDFTVALVMGGSGYHMHFG
jgi:glycerate-2-kinase